MATVLLVHILDMLKGKLVKAYDERNDATKWEVSIEEHGLPKRAGKVVSASLEPLGFEFKIEDETKPITLKAYPSVSSLKKEKVDVNGHYDEDAAMLFVPFRGSLENPARFHLDFKRVTIDGEDVRINLAYPKG